MPHLSTSIHTFASLAFGLALFAALPSPALAVECVQTYGSGSTAPSGYGASWNVFSSDKEVLVRVVCESDVSTPYLAAGVTTEDQDTMTNTFYVYEKAHVYQSGKWRELQLKPSSGSPSTQSGKWIIGRGVLFDALPQPTTSKTYVVGYVCTKQGGVWKCGCKNSSCTTSHWQLQAYSSPGAGGGGGGTDTSTPGTLPTAPTYNGTTYYVSPSGSGISMSQSAPGNPVATIQGVDDGSVVKFLPGTYGAINVTNPKGSGRIKMIATVPAIGSINTAKRTSISYASAPSIVSGVRTDGAVLKGGIEVGNFSEPWVEGFYIPFDSSGRIGMTDVTSPWIVRNRIDNVRPIFGILVYDSLGTGNVVVLENWVHNSRRDNDNPPNWQMDYGIALYGNPNNSAYVTKNLVQGGYNQPFSTKKNFKNTFVENNFFVAGDGKEPASPGVAKNTILGQEWDRPGEDNSGENVYIRGNTFRSDSQGMIIAHVQNVVVDNNNFIDMPSPAGIYLTINGPGIQFGKVPESVVFKNNWMSKSMSIRVWPRGNQAETLTIENNTVAGGGRSTIVLNKSFGDNEDADRPPVSPLILPTVNRVGGDASGFSAPEIVN